MAYTGQSRAKKTMAYLDANGIGEIWTAGQDPWPPRRTPWAMDCGTFRHWRAGTPWDAEPFKRALTESRRLGMSPDFVVAPDVIGGGLASLALSLSWLPQLHGFRVYLAVQDGMKPRQVARVIHRFAGLFVGGTLAWKIQTSAAWVELAHAHGKPCHIGRVGIPKRVRWAQRIEADSIDSCQPLWSEQNLTRWVAAMGQARQHELWRVPA